MLERYRTLGAALTLGEFSVSELSALSGVREATVRTTLRRSTDYVEQAGTQPTGRRGGRPTRWRLRAGAREPLLDLLRELERLGVGPWIGERQDDSQLLPAAIMAAEDVLLRHVPAAVTPDERTDLVKLAQAHLAAVPPASPSIPIGEAQGSDDVVSQHQRVAELLIELEEAEKPAMPSADSRPPSDGQAITMDLLLTAGKIDNERLTSAVKHRLLNTPIPAYMGPVATPAVLPAGLAIVGIELLPYWMTAVLINAQGDRLAQKRVSLKDMTFEAVVSKATSLTRAITDATAEPGAIGNPAAVGFQIGSPVASDSGTVLFYKKTPPTSAGTLREAWWPECQPLGPLLSQATRAPVVVENDANAFATYELWFGAGREVPRFAVVLIREGVGGSLVINRRLFDGPMEVGNLSVLPDGKRTCDCGSVGCLETHGGIYGILEMVYDFTGEHPDTVKEAAKIAEADDTNTAMQAFKRAGEANAKGISIIVNFARPKQVVLYGPSVMTRTGSSQVAEVFLSEVNTFNSYCHPAYKEYSELKVKPLRQFDGAHGAALRALERCIGITAEMVLADAGASR
jgi:predicted NBD/HSP70 family sugar kinase